MMTKKRVMNMMEMMMTIMTDEDKTKRKSF